MLHATARIYRSAQQLDADIYHFHDPELIPAGIRLKRLGKTVIFDAHEDVPLQLLGKPYLHPAVGRLTAAAFSAYERHTCQLFDGVVAATPSIRDKFLQINPNTVDVNNFPLRSEFDAAAPWSEKPPEVCYVGSISAVRGIRELVAACAKLRSPARLNLAGSFDEASLEADMVGQSGWSRVQRHGHLDRAGVGAIMARSMAGLVTLHPQPNYLESLPVKMFEYMAAGIPVIASSIPLWRRIIDEAGCGMCVDPGDPCAIADAIDYLVSNPEHARRMGDNGRQAVIEQYNWEAESIKLIDFYHRLQN